MVDNLKVIKKQFNVKVPVLRVETLFVQNFRKIIIHVSSNTKTKITKRFFKYKKKIISVAMATDASILSLFYHCQNNTHCLFTTNFQTVQATSKQDHKTRTIWATFQWMFYKSQSWKIIKEVLPYNKTIITRLKALCFIEIRDVKKIIFHSIEGKISLVKVESLTSQ